jgi:hypothetical protein
MTGLEFATTTAADDDDVVVMMVVVVWGGFEYSSAYHSFLCRGIFVEDY